MADAWWKSAVIYQIYPRSFQDSDNDGVGDLRGIIARLSYLAALGIDALWLSPIFPSPMADFGYDVADYVGIDPLFGTLADFDELLAHAHGLGLKVLLDLVPNHTSDLHPWFLESRSSRSNSKRDWYLWHDGAANGGPPNNWHSEFGGSAWELDPGSDQYYYHAFLKQQPDLNWRNREVRHAIYEAMRFWFARGVDGFRIDVLWHLIKDDQFRDNPANPNFAPGRPPHETLIPLYSTDRPEIAEVLAELRDIADEFSDRLLIGEIYFPLERLVTYYGRDLRGVHLPFNFSLLSSPWQAGAIARLIEDYEATLPAGGWPNWVLGNHDRPHIAGRVGPAQARIAAMLLLTLCGTPTIYYGDEIGMTQVAIPANRVQDPFEKNVPGLGIGRDGNRTPMQWDATAHAGFTDIAPWLPLTPDLRERNVAVQCRDPRSIYHLYRRLIALRRSRSATLVEGAYRPILARGDLLLFSRESQGERLLIALNLGGLPEAANLADGLAGMILLSSHLDRDGEAIRGRIDLRPNEGVIIEGRLAADQISKAGPPETAVGPLHVSGLA
jgi:alpha-glucosidase